MYAPTRYALCAGKVAAVLLMSVFLRLVPALRRMIFEQMLQDVPERSKLMEGLEDWDRTAGGWQHIKQMVQMYYREARTDTVSDGSDAHDVLLLDEDGKTERHLLDYAQGSRPLVVLFSSCSCPIFMAKLDGFSKLAKEFAGTADFLTVYIEEAHPSDGWAIQKNAYHIKQHQSVEDRLKAARKLLEKKLPFKVALDTLNNEASSTYAAMPFRVYVIKNGKIVYGGEKVMGCKMEKLQHLLKSCSVVMTSG